MPLNNYAVLKGRPINNRLATGASPHYQVLVSENGTLHRIAINVRSQDGSEVEFLVRSRFEHPITDFAGGSPGGPAQDREQARRRRARFHPRQSDAALGTQAAAAIRRRVRTTISTRRSTPMSSARCPTKMP